MKSEKVKNPHTCVYGFFGRGVRTWSRRDTAKPSSWFRLRYAPQSVAALTPHRGVIHYRSHSSPLFKSAQKKQVGDCLPAFFGAGKRTWTFTEEPRLEPESSASANSAIPAYLLRKYAATTLCVVAHRLRRISFDFHSERGLRGGAFSSLPLFALCVNIWYYIIVIRFCQ